MEIGVFEVTANSIHPLSSSPTLRDIKMTT